MKTLSFLLLILSSGCSNAPQDIVKNKVEDHLKTVLHDPSTYEFVSLDLIDTVPYRENIDYAIEDLSSGIRRDESSIELQKMYKADDEVARLQAANNRRMELKNELKKITTGMGAKVDEPASYTYVYNFRAANGFGAIVLHNYYVQTGPAPEYEIITVAETYKQMHRMPNEFPGYEAMKEDLIKY